MRLSVIIRQCQQVCVLFRLRLLGEVSSADRERLFVASKDRNRVDIRVGNSRILSILRVDLT